MPILPCGGAGLKWCRRWLHQATDVIRILFAGLASVACNNLTPVTLDLPDNLRDRFRAGAPAADYTYYTLNTHPVPHLGDRLEGGLAICSDKRPPLIPEGKRRLIDGGGRSPLDAI